MRLIASEWFYTFDLGSAWCWNNQVVAGGWNSHSWWHWHRPLTCGWCWHGWGCSDTTSRKRRTWRQTWGRRFWNTHTCKKNIETWNTHDASVIILEKKQTIYFYIFLYIFYIFHQKKYPKIWHILKLDAALPGVWNPWGAHASSRTGNAFGVALRAGKRSANTRRCT